MVDFLKFNQFACALREISCHCLFWTNLQHDVNIDHYDLSAVLSVSPIKAGIPLWHCFFYLADFFLWWNVKLRFKTSHQYCTMFLRKIGPSVLELLMPPSWAGIHFSWKKSILFWFVSMTVMTPRATGGNRRRLKMESMVEGIGSVMPRLMTHDSSWWLE